MNKSIKMKLEQPMKLSTNKIVSINYKPEIKKSPLSLYNSTTVTIASKELITPREVFLHLNLRSAVDY